MTFMDSSPSDVEYVVRSGADATRTSRYSASAELGEFFSRPVKIDTRDWSVLGNTHHTFNPWNLFFMNKRVANRISNYKLMRATLKVKFVINGNGFYYGKAIASYQPLHLWDDFSRNRALVSQDIIQASQQPHVYLDPTTSTGGTLTLPFFYIRDFVDISKTDWDELGQITIRSINELTHANGGTDSVNITTFAWAEDVELMVPTQNDIIALVPQANFADEQDEANINGIISGPATTVAAVSSNLKDIPWFSPFARPTEIAARLTATIAKLFGFSRPAVTKAPEPYQPSITSSFATCTTPDVINKMSVDDKQALCMGQEIAGICSAEPLSVLSIAMRESYLTTFSWPLTAVSDSLLWNINVNPMLYDTYLDGVNPKEYHLTAMATAALPFEYWCGTIHIRFQIVCSAFHKGRLRVVYEPGSVEPTPEYNVNYQEVVDIAEKQDFTISVSMSQTTGLLKVIRPDIVATTSLFSTSALAPTNGETNGTLALYVVNELVSPNSVVAYDAQVNVFVKAGDDFKVFAPRDYHKFVEFVPESDFSDTVADSASAGVNPIASPTTQVGTGNDVVDQITGVYCGECIGSFRQLLKRYNKHGPYGMPTGSGDCISLSSRLAFPYHRGAVAGAVNTSVDGPYSYVDTTLINYLVPAFAGWRGSLRYRAVPCLMEDTASPFTMYACRDDTRLYQDFDVIGLTSNADRDTVCRDVVAGNRRYLPSGASGMAMTQSNVNPILSFEVPYQMNIRFSPAKWSNWTSGGADFCTGYEVAYLGQRTNNSWVDSYVAAGEDFQVYFWTGLPPINLNLNPPALPP